MAYGPDSAHGPVNIFVESSGPLYGVEVGKFPLTLTVLSRDSNTPFANPYYKDC